MKKKKNLAVMLMMVTIISFTACSSDSSSDNSDNNVLESVSVTVTEEDSTIVTETVTEEMSDNSTRDNLNSITISTENGDYIISIDSIHQVADDWYPNKDEGMKIVTIQASVENINYSGFYDNSISYYEIYDTGVKLLDDEGYELEFVDVIGPTDGKYEVGAEISIGSKKRVSLPFYVSEDCNSVMVKVGEYCSELIELNGTEVITIGDSVESVSENSLDKEEKFIAEGETTLMNFLNGASDNGYSITKPSRDGTTVSAIASGANGNFDITYFVEDQHVYNVSIIADSTNMLSDENFLDCVNAMAKAINPELTDDIINNSVNQAITTPDNPVVDGDCQFLYISDDLAISISH